MTATLVVYDPATSRHRAALVGEVPAGVAITAAPKLSLVADKHSGLLHDGSSCTFWTTVHAKPVGLDPFLLTSPDVDLWLEVVVYRNKRKTRFNDPIRSPSGPRYVTKHSGFYHPTDLYNPHSYLGVRGGSYTDPTGVCHTEWKASGLQLHDTIKIPSQEFGNWFRKISYQTPTGSQSGVGATGQQAYYSGRVGYSGHRQTRQVRFRWAAMVSTPTGKQLIHGPESETIYIGDPRTMGKIDFTQSYGTLQVLNERHPGELNIAAGFSPLKRLYVSEY